MRSWPSRYLATVQPLPSSMHQVFRRNLDVVEEHLVHLVAAVHQDQRAHRDPGRFHVHQQERDALLASSRQAGVGAHEAENPVGEMPERGPDLLAVDDVVVAMPRSAFGLERREVGSPNPARNSPGTRSPRPGRCAAGSASSAPRCRSAAAPARTWKGRTESAAGCRRSRVPLRRGSAAPRSSRCRPTPSARPAPPSLSSREFCASEVDRPSRGVRSLRPSSLVLQEDSFQATHELRRETRARLPSN